MDRSDWLKQMRVESEQLLDSEAPTYDVDWGSTIEVKTRRFVERFLRLCRSGGTVFDAACGTGKYWQVILDSGRAVFGIDQSGGMLEQATSKFPNVRTEKVGLQEMSYRQEFDGAICVDAMEMVFPEDWTLVMGNLRRAVKPEGHLYFTVETVEEGFVERAFAQGRQMGLPVVYGESLDEGIYHYYPGIEQAKRRIEQAGLSLIDEAEESFVEDGDSWGYHHFLVQRD